MKPGQIKCPVRSTVVAECSALSAAILSSSQAPASRVMRHTRSIDARHVTRSLQHVTCSHHSASGDEQAAVLVVFVRGGVGQEVGGEARGGGGGEVQDGGSECGRGGRGGGRHGAEVAGGEGGEGEGAFQERS